VKSARELLLARAAQVAAERSDDVPSPCMSVCRMNADGELCLGCFRTLDEIAAWGRMGDDGKRDIWVQITNRIAKEET
jgi:uncharacterized protein